MAMVQPKSQKLRLLATHLLLLAFIAAIMFPLLMVVAISLRPGNFATGSLIPDQISWEHWRLALGFSVEHADGRVTPPPVPVLRLRLRPYAISGQGRAAERDADFPDVPGGAVAGGALCAV